MMARRWQHHCIEIREAAQQILLGELGRMGKKGRKQLVESWAQFLPLYTHTEPIVQQLPQSASQQSISGAPAQPVQEPNVLEKFTKNYSKLNNFDFIYLLIYLFILQPDDFEEEEEEIVRKPSSLAELKRKQTTAVVLLGVIGAEFGQDISNDSK